jgi:4-hydroxy-tetrahydrodipicolinate synthase
MKNSLPCGVMPAIITPTDECERVDEPALRQVVRRMLDAGVNGILVGGSTGEGPLLPEKEWRRMVEIAADEVADRMPLMAGVMETSSCRACDKVSILQSLGYRYVLLTTTYYMAAKTHDEQLRHFGRVREATGDGLEVIAYNIPQSTGAYLIPETLCDMAQRGWIRCCKESSGNWDYLKDLICRGKQSGLTLWNGDEATFGQSLLEGAKGIVPVSANYDPVTFLRLYESAMKGDHAALARWTARAQTLRETLVLSGPCWFSGAKYALAALGIGLGKPVAPLEPATRHQVELINALIQRDKENPIC